RRHHPALAPGPLAAGPGATRVAQVVRGNRASAGAGPRANGTARRACGCGRVEAAGRRTRKAHARDPATRLRAGRARLQYRFAQTIAGTAVRGAAIAGHDEDTHRPTLHERGSPGSDRRPARTAAIDPGLPCIRETAQ